VFYHTKKVEKLLKQGGSHYLRVDPQWAKTIYDLFKKNQDHMFVGYFGIGAYYLPNIDAIVQRERIPVISRLMDELDLLRDTLENRLIKEEEAILNAIV